MKKYIAPDLEVEMYTLDTALAGVCTTTDTAYIVDSREEFFSSGDAVEISPNGYVIGHGENPHSNVGGYQEGNGGHDCYYTSYGVMMLAVS